MCVWFIQINKCVVWCICEFVRRITQPKQVIKTMMNAHNLAIVFAPSLLRYSRGFLTTPVPPVISTHVTDTAPWGAVRVRVVSSRCGDQAIMFYLSTFEVMFVQNLFQSYANLGVPLISLD